MSKYLVVLITICLAGTTWCQGKTIHTGTSAGMAYQVEEVLQGQGVIWGITFLSPSELLFTERAGLVKKLHIPTQQLTELKGVPEVWAHGQGGLLDIARPPNFEETGWLYFTYSKPIDGQGATTLSRARLQGDSLADWQELLVTRSATATGRHFGSRIAFDRSGHVFFSVGDRGVRPNGQDLSTHAGSIIRLNLDGSVPSDNPLIGREKELPEIYSYGHRNPQGLFWDTMTGRLWANEHGPRGGDEINLIDPGKNYGWPVVSHGKEYWGPVSVGEATSKPGMVDPVKVYIPSIAPGSLVVYSGQAFPNWRGNLFSGALALVHLNRVVLDQRLRATDEERLLTELDERIRALAESPEGWLYLSTDSGRILRLRPPSP